MKKLCVYPVRKWEDIPIETRERIKRELSVPLPTHLKGKYKNNNTKDNYILNYYIPTIIALLLIIVTISTLILMTS